MPPSVGNVGFAKIRRRPGTDLPQTDWPTSQLELPATLPEVQPLEFEMIQADLRSPVWNLFIERYHYQSSKYEVKNLETGQTGGL